MLESGLALHEDDQAQLLRFERAQKVSWVQDATFIGRLWFVPHSRNSIGEVDGNLWFHSRPLEWQISVRKESGVGARFYMADSGGIVHRIQDSAVDVSRLRIWRTN